MFDDLTQRLVQDAIVNRLPGLNKKVDFHIYTSAGSYDPETDSEQTVYTTVSNVVVVACKVVFADVQDHGAVFTDTKLLIPGLSLSSPLKVEDKVTLDGKEWNVRRCMEVPGGSLYIAFVHRT